MRQPDAAAPRPRRTILRRLLLAAGTVCLFLLGYAAVAFGSRLSWRLLPGNGVRLPGAVAGLPLLDIPTPTAGSRINILIMGTDHWYGRPDEYTGIFPNGEDDVGHSNSIAVLSIDPAQKTASILSIPRDLWVDVPDGKGGWTMDRINAAYHTGELDKLPGGGGATAAMTITHDFGIPIDHYVVLDFAGFMKIIDALGPLDIDVPNTFTATVVPEANTGGYEYTFFAGKQDMNGELALAYARFRYDAQGDFGRIQRQQQIALAARQKALSLGWVTRAPSLWSEYRQSIETDLQGFEIPGYALLAKQLDPIQTYSLGQTDTTTSAVIAESGADILLPKPRAMAGIISEALGNPSAGAAALSALQQQYPAPVPSLGVNDQGLEIIHAPEIATSPTRRTGR
jgi:LCP family protein required for cell wall assembly